MNSFIEFLNGAGDQLAKIARPMLWQSSLLILVMWAVQHLLRQKVRASARYALWLIVLLKLLLPPSLALPTGVAWWLRPPMQPTVQPAPVTYTVAYGPELAAPPVYSPAAPGTLVPYRAELALPGKLLAGCSAISMALFAWMLLRWLQVGREIRRADSAPAWLAEVLIESKRRAGFNPRVRIRVFARQISPAVCGLFRPVILLPASLLGRLPADRLRAVLLHELIHLKRFDVWLNFLQALLQCVYWWHPLVWFANARIRRVREDAVDDAVMLALRDEADTYAPTLLAVAKLALNRPLASLGLVGILESHQALRPRIERLLELRTPKRAGLTLASAFCLLAFASVALPMGQAPAPSKPSERMAVSEQTAPSNPFGELNSEITARIPVLSDLPFLGPLFRTSGVERSASPTAFADIHEPAASGQVAVPEKFLSAETLGRVQGLRIETKAEIVRLRSLIEQLKKLPPDKLSQAIPVGELHETILPSLLERLSKAEQDAIALKQEFGPAHPQVIRVSSQVSDLNSKITTRTEGIIAGLEIKAVSLEQVVNAVIEESSNTWDAATNKWQEKGSNVAFPKRRVGSDSLFVRQIPINLPNILNHLPGTADTNDAAGRLRRYFADLGHNFESPKSLYVDAKEGIVILKSTLEDLDFVENTLRDLDYSVPLLKTLQELESLRTKYTDSHPLVQRKLAMVSNLEAELQQVKNPPPQITVTARFFELAADSPGYSSSATDILSRTNLSPLETKELLKKLMAPSLSPDKVSVTTLSGRAAQIQIAPTQASAGPPNGPLTPLPAPGSITKTLDVIPSVTESGWQIELKATATVAEFLGLEEPARLSNNSAGQAPVPHYRFHQLTARQETTKLWDGDSLMLQEADASSNTQRFILLTATLIDPAGNRIHTDEEIEQAKATSK